MQAKKWFGGAVITGMMACAAAGCDGGETEKPPAPATPPAPVAEFKPPVPVQEALVGGPFPTLLVGQAQFYKGPTGKPVPGAALLTVWRKTAEGWKSTKLEDADSNVFHKVLPYEGGLLTIGAEKALLKKWTFADGKWNQETLWAPPPWGGKFNRIRDLEIGDVNGDGKADLVMATHDSGVIAVGSFKDGKLEVTELEKAPDRFVHEIEIGDIDGDGKNEFFATPSDRNQSSGKSQPGQVVMFRWDGTTYQKSMVESFEGSHAKEILAVDLKGKGTVDLFSSIEAHTELVDGKAKVVNPVEIRHYKYNKKDNTFTHTVAATIDDKQNRFLVPGDFNGDGKMDLVAAAMKSGLWLLEQGKDDAWTATNFEQHSSGFEHTCFGADLDGNGLPELYVAADDQRELRSYAYNATTKTFDKTVIGPIPKDTITWNMTTGSF